MKKILRVDGTVNTFYKSNSAKYFSFRKINALPQGLGTEDLIIILIIFLRDMFVLPNKKAMEVVMHFLFTRLHPQLAYEELRYMYVKRV